MYKTLAVVGLSSKPARPSYGVSAYMLAHGFRIIPVNPHEATVLGQKAYGSLDEVPGPLEIVVVFRRSSAKAPKLSGCRKACSTTKPRHTPELPASPSSRTAAF
jgi:predicted CoA-binding protein